jgi:signal transduction histidine kinase
MSKSTVTAAVEGFSKDEALVRHLLVVWPVVESILGAFSKATDLPIFVFLNNHLVFETAKESMPPFCNAMLSSPETEARCIADAARRAKMHESTYDGGVQICHAGMLNGRREIDTGVGMLVVFFGAKRSDETIAVHRREQIISSLAAENPDLASKLKEAVSQDEHSHGIDSRDMELMDAISEILARLFTATVGFRSLTINMAHELSVMMLGMGLLIEEMDDLIDELNESGTLLSPQMGRTQSSIFAQCRLGLYIVRNFLSHASETRYTEVVRPQFREINLREILSEMLDLHRLAAEKKGITIDDTGLDELPTFVGNDMEMRRLLHNVLNNAVKYSYHSVPTAHRTIRVRSKVPYDPGFRSERFSLVFENYGLGLAEDEKRNVFKAGFRGQQAIAEVLIGSGIGLSEALKIAKAHHGDIRLNSKELFEEKGKRTYLTTVEVILPYARQFRFAKRKAT